MNINNIIMNKPLVRNTSRNASLQLLSKMSTNKSDTSNQSVRLAAKSSKKTCFPQKIVQKYSIRSMNLIRDKKTIIANKIRSTLLVRIDGERRKSRISKCKINSKTADEILASYDSIEVTIDNPVEIGTPILCISRQSCDSNSTPQKRIKLEEKIDLSGVVYKIRKKKTISGAKFRNFVQSSLGLKEEEKEEKAKNHPINQKDSKYELMIQSCHYLSCLVTKFKKKNKLKSKLFSQDSFSSMHNSLNDYSSHKSKHSKSNKKRNNRKSIDSSNNKKDYPFKSDDDNEHYVLFNSNNLAKNTQLNENRKKKAMTVLAFNCSSFKTVNNTNHIMKSCNDNYNTKESGNIIFLNYEEENEINETTTILSLDFNNKSPIYNKAREQDRDLCSLFEEISRMKQKPNDKILI